eukprot:m.74125 g.74125  ORF g.74125 m.74125 type:complete len:509 (+) comp14408_c0_seq3:1229-2755(+)
MAVVVQLVAVAMAVLLLIAGTSAAACSTSLDCSLNGDCVAGQCKCDPAWTGAVCAEINILPTPVDNGYNNESATSWGGYPVYADGKWHLFHAQMYNGCGLGSWTSNSFVARSTASKVEGPYTFQEVVFDSFAHNPTIRQASDGTFVLYYIGGWHTTPSKCDAAEDLLAEQRHPEPRFGHNASCASGAKLDDKSRIRVGSDYSNVLLPSTATVQDCVAACCADTRCQAFSFNTPATPGGEAPGCPGSKGHACCKLKDSQPPTESSSCPTCQTGTVPGGTADCQPKTHWPKTCGQNMPGPSGDTCGPASKQLNSGCGIAMATSSSVYGPWKTQPLNITNQFDSDLLYCAHTNPSPYFLPNGTVVVAFNAGFCNHGLETIGVAWAPHFSGPYKLLTTLPILGGESPHHCEDPFIWKSERGWHLLVHNQQGPQGISAYAFSVDAVNWTLSPVTPYNSTVVYVGGEIQQHHMERPQIWFGASGKPEFLINGAERRRSANGADSFTIIRPINSA